MIAYTCEVLAVFGVEAIIVGVAVRFYFLELFFLCFLRFLVYVVNYWEFSDLVLFVFAKEAREF